LEFSDKIAYNSSTICLDHSFPQSHPFAEHLYGWDFLLPEAAEKHNLKEKMKKDETFSSESVLYRVRQKER
jgi:hypothetical protein